MDLNASNASELFHILDLNASNASELFHIIGPQCLQCIGTIPYYWTSMPPMHHHYCIFWTSMPPMHHNYSILLDLNASNASELLTATTAAAAAAAAAVSQELWNLGGALVQRAQEQNIPCGESLTSTTPRPRIFFIVILFYLNGLKLREYFLFDFGLGWKPVILGILENKPFRGPRNSKILENNPF